MNEITFVIEEDANGGYVAKGLGEAIFTQANNLADLHESIQEAVNCHYDEGKAPTTIHLHFVQEKTTPMRHGVLY